MTTDLIQNPAAQVAIVAFIAMVAQWTGWRMKIPSIVFLLLGGFVFGSVFGFIQPEIIFGDALQPIVSVAVAIILFEGSLTLDFAEIKQGRRILKQIVLIGGPIAWVLTAAAGHYLGGLSWPVAIPFGALLIVTGPTVIMPLLKQAKLNTRVGSLLKWEGIVNDPIGAVLAILAYEYFKITADHPLTLTQFGTEIGLKIVVISILSVILGYALSSIFNRGLVPEFLKSTFLTCAVICAFVLSNMIVHESCLITVTIMGIVMANKDITSIEDLRRFKEAITIMLVSGAFILLTANIQPEILLNIDWKGVLFIFSVLFVVRPISIFIAGLGTDLTFKESILVSYIAPRGVVCAAIAGLMGPLLVEAGYADGEKLLPLAFAIVLTTVILHSLTAKKIAQKLGLAVPAKEGIIIVGGMHWTVQFAKTLQAKDINVMIADKEWPSLKEARLNDIPIYYGEILSEETDHALELNRYNTLLAATGNPSYNALVCNKYAHEFGRERVFQLSSRDEGDHERQKVTQTMRGRTLAYEDLDCWDFERLYHEGWRFKTTRVSELFNLDDLQEQRDTGQARLIGKITANGKLHFSHAEKPKELKSDTIAILFAPADPETANGNNGT